MSIGFACKTVGVEGTQQKSVIQKNATPEKIDEVIRHNLQALENTLEYNIRNKIYLFRISSDIIPFGSSPVNTLDWQDTYKEALAAIGQKAMDAGVRLSMHPGQYTVLNSPDRDVVCRAVADLEYHCNFLDALKLPPSHKIVLHIGGVYGDKPLAVNRFIENNKRLPEQVKARLIIENDDRCYTIEEVLNVSKHTGAPVVFDNLHHRLNPPADTLTDEEWIAAAGRTWKKVDGDQKMHYSQQAKEGKPGAHSATIYLDEFLHYFEKIQRPNLDVMLEVKDKNRSAVKCILATGTRKDMGRLEKEWGRYKYLVMEHDLNVYREVRVLLKDKAGYPVQEMFTLIEAALDKPLEQGGAVNAAQHVWGYFKEKADTIQAKRFLATLDRYKNNTGSAESVKKSLYRLAKAFEEGYLLESYYFDF